MKKGISRGLEQSAVDMSNITPEQKKRRFRELATHDRIRTGSQLAEELEQPYLPLMDVNAPQREAMARRAWDGAQDTESGTL